MKIKIKKPTRGGHADSYFDEENAEIGYDIISEDQLEDEETFTEGEYGIPDNDEEESQKKPKAKKRRG